MGDLRVVDLFAGGGGMGLAFLMGRRARHCARLIYSAENHPEYLRSLQRNVAYFGERIGSTDQVPSKISPTDLTSQSDADRLFEAVDAAGGVDVLLGGPPCVGFSTANSLRAPDHPLNDLVLTFADYANALKPKVVIVENVPGIAHNSRHHESKLAQLKRKLQRNFRCYHRILNAADFGVPQRRQRFFLIAVNRDLDIDLDENNAFPEPTHGPGRQRPFVTVRDAISDLPKVENGESRRVQKYAADAGTRFVEISRRFTPGDALWDHVVSRSAPYVIRRYKKIPPGGNLHSIKKRIHNYYDISQAHSNIYRRLTWDDVSVTIGNFRKSMLIHPEQHRGLSLREAARLQSFPDWFGFWHDPDDGRIALNHHQQQVGNAVSFLLTMAISDHVMEFF